MRERSADWAARKETPQCRSSLLRPEDWEWVNGGSASKIHPHKFEYGADSEWLVKDGDLEVWRG